MRATDTRTVVEDIEHLMELCDDGITDYAIALNGGVRSGKHILWNGKRFCVFSNIDGSHDLYTVQEFKQSFIHEAILARCLYVC